jgi:hypothetical protein
MSTIRAMFLTRQWRSPADLRQIREKLAPLVAGKEAAANDAVSP